MSSSNFDFDKAYREIEKYMVTDTVMDRVMKTICCDIGARPACTPAIKKAREFLSEEWMSFGTDNVHEEDVSLTKWDQGSSILEIVEPVNRVYKCEQCINSGSGNVEGVLIDGGNLSFEKLWHLGSSVKGAVLLVKGNEIGIGGQFEPIQKRLSLAEAAGASAIILIGSHNELPNVFFLNKVCIPVLVVSTKTAEELAGLCSKGNVRVKLAATGKANISQCANLIGEMAPDGGADEIIVNSAHLDGIYLSPAALDNLSGIAVMTGVARALAPYRKHFVRTLRMIATTGEEYGFAGSKSYVRSHENELDSIKFVLNNDCLFESTAKGMAVMWSPEMKDYIAKFNPDLDVRNYFCMSSDYLPFMLEGIAAARPADWGNAFPPFTHTTEDKYENVPASWLKSNALVCARILLKLLTETNELPVRRKSNKEIMENIRNEIGDIKENLRWQIALY